MIPEETRIARLAIEKPGWSTHDAKGVLRVKPLAQSGVDDPNLLLVYFDRPCRLYGRHYSSDGRFEVDVTINAAGFSWLRWVNDPKTGERRIVSGDAFQEVALVLDPR